MQVTKYCHYKKLFTFYRKYCIIPCIVLKLFNGENKMENNETKSCVIRDEFLPKAKVFFTSKKFLIIAACVVCFFVGFFAGNTIGKSSQKKADAVLIAAANARATARYRRPAPRQANRQRVNRPAAARQSSRPTNRPAARPTNR